MSIRTRVSYPPFKPLSKDPNPLYKHPQDHHKTLPKSTKFRTLSMTQHNTNQINRIPTKKSQKKEHTNYILNKTSYQKPSAGSLTARGFQKRAARDRQNPLRFTDGVGVELRVADLKAESGHENERLTRFSHGWPVSAKRIAPFLTSPEWF